ncbi:MAG: FAD-dependent oxidoreductase [Armatimonadetes bacterium]|nr:FAD-dependent oxidoreductase [Armatimonadota bacterium]
MVHLPDFDIIICGGGPAGIAAGITAGRRGAKCLLIERYGFLGGMSTAALVNPWFTFHNQKGEQIVRGVAQEIVDRLVALGASPGHLRDTVGFVYSCTSFDPEVYKRVAEEMLREAGCRVLYHSLVLGAEVAGPHLREIVVACKSEQRKLRAKVFIDTTGDADLSAFAGVPFQKGRETDGAMQPMTMNFRVGEVDLKPVADYIRQNPKEFHHETLFDQLEPLTGVSGFFALWRDAKLDIPRDRLLFFAGARPGEVNVNTSRIVGKDGTNAEDLTAAEQEGRRQVMLIVGFLREKIPGFENSYLLALPAQVGLRETRRIVGDYILTGEDVIQGAAFEDTIALSDYPVDIHSPTGVGLTLSGAAEQYYGIPYRSLLPRNVDNLLVAGRCLSATHEGHASARLTPTCMAMGQAVGTAAAMCVEGNHLPRGLNVSELRDALRTQGGRVE